MNIIYEAGKDRPYPRLLIKFNQDTNTFLIAEDDNLYTIKWVVLEGGEGEYGNGYSEYWNNYADATKYGQACLECGRNGWQYKDNFAFGGTGETLGFDEWCLCGDCYEIFKKELQEAFDNPTKGD